MENTRISAYDSYPSVIAVMTKYINYIETPRIQYSNQLSTNYYNGVNPTGQANLFMAWACDADTRHSTINEVGTFNPKGAIHALPHQRYVLSSVGAPYVFEYDNYTITLNRQTYQVRYDAVFGPPADFFQDWIRMTIFNDSFVAPFIKGTIS